MMRTVYVRSWHFADIPPAPTNVRFQGNNGRDADVTRCLLMTQSGRHLGEQDPFHHPVASKGLVSESPSGQAHHDQLNIDNFPKWAASR